MHGSQGLVWRHIEGAWWGHSGGEQGVTTDLLLNVETGTSIVVLAKGDWDDDDTIYTIENLILDHLSGASPSQRRGRSR